MKIQFAAGPLALDIVEQLADPRLTVENALVTLDLEGLSRDESPVEVKRLESLLNKTAAASDDAATRFAISSVIGSLAKHYSYASKTKDAVDTIVTEVDVTSQEDESESHSLPPEDASISFVSQANSDETETNEELNNGQESKRSRRKRSSGNE